MLQSAVITKRRKVLLRQGMTGLMIFPWLGNEQEILVKMAGGVQACLKLKHCRALDGRVLWSLLMCYAARRPATSTLSTTTSRWHKTCGHSRREEDFALIYWSVSKRLDGWLTKVGRAFWLAAI